VQIDVRALGALVLPFGRASATPVLLDHFCAALPPLFKATHCVGIAWAPCGSFPRHLQKSDVHFSGNWSPSAKHRYYTEYRERDPISRWLISANDRCDSPVATLSNLVSPQNLKRTGFFKDILQPDGLLHSLTLAVRDGERLLADFSVVRAAFEGDYTSDEIELASAILPVLEAEIRRALTPREGEASLPPRVHEFVRFYRASELPKQAALTAREEEVLTLVASGLSNKAVARKLRRSPDTIKNHLKAIFRKCSVSNRTALCARSLR
jgi:DNA-binding CsgD family transcriptional regulator